MRQYSRRWIFLELSQERSGEKKFIHGKRKKHGRVGGRIKYRGGGWRKKISWRKRENVYENFHSWSLSYPPTLSLSILEPSRSALFPINNAHSHIGKRGVRWESVGGKLESPTNVLLKTFRISPSRLRTNLLSSRYVDWMREGNNMKNLTTTTTTMNEAEAARESKKNEWKFSRKIFSAAVVVLRFFFHSLFLSSTAIWMFS